MSYSRRKIENLEELVLSGRKHYVRYDEGADLYKMGIHGFQHMAWEACAVRKIDGICIVNINVVQEFLRNNDYFEEDGGN